MGFGSAKCNAKRLADALGLDKDTVQNAINQSLVGGYARIFKVEDKGKYSIAQVSISRKTDDGTWDVEFQDGYVRLVGHAHEKAKQIAVGEKGVPIQLVSCDVTKRYVREKDKEYTNFVVFEFTVQEFGDKNNGNSGTVITKKSATTADVEVDDEELPF